MLRSLVQLRSMGLGEKKEGKQTGVSFALNWTILIRALSITYIERQHWYRIVLLVVTTLCNNLYQGLDCCE